MGRSPDIKITTLTTLQTSNAKRSGVWSFSFVRASRSWFQNVEERSWRSSPLTLILSPPRGEEQRLPCSGVTLDGDARQTDSLAPIGGKGQGEGARLPFSRIAKSLWLLLAASCFVAGCATTARETSLQRFEFSSPHMGTLFSITLYAADEANARSAARAAFRRVAELDSIMSDYDATSELMQLREKAVGQPISISLDLFDVLQRAQKFSELTDGALDVTVGPYVHLWRMARKKKVLPTPEEIAQARAAVGYRKIKLDAPRQTLTFLAPNMRLDLGGIGKGYAADKAMQVLKDYGITRALVAASGDIAIGDAPPGKKGWRVGISPMGARTNATIKTLLLHNAAISTSGDTEQFVEINGTRYSHIVDPKTGLGLTERIQVSVIAPNATTTDALDTAVSVMGAKRGLALIDSLPKTAALVIVSEGGRKSLLRSRRFKTIPEAREGLN